MMRVLIVDDEEMIRDLAAKILRKEGIEITVAESGTEGLEALSTPDSSVDLVILDLIMDGMSGRETLEAMRRTHPELPCIFSTGHLFNKDELPEHLKPNTHFLQKPYRASVLRELVRQIVPVG